MQCVISFLRSLLAVKALGGRRATLVLPPQVCADGAHAAREKIELLGKAQLPAAKKCAEVFAECLRKKMSCRNGRKRRAGPRFRVGQQDAKFHGKPRLLLGRQTCTATVRVSCQEHILCCAGVSSVGISKGSTETTRGRYATRTTGAATAHMR
ncbi:hypothetical protein TGMAS_312120, partial [Toxoplasma gondii MAS]